MLVAVGAHRSRDQHPRFAYPDVLSQGHHFLLTPNLGYKFTIGKKSSGYTVERCYGYERAQRRAISC